MFTIYIFYRFDINYYCTRVDFFFTPKFFTILFQTLFEPMFIAVYNVFYTSQPVLALGIFDQDVDATHSLKFPKLYAPGLSSALFNKREFFKSALHGFISSCFLFFISHGEIHIHSGPENLKKSRPKKLVKSNKSISRKKFFDQNPFFCHFKNGQK